MPQPLRWTADNDAELLRMLREGARTPLLAKRLGRTKSAIETRIRVLGWSFRTGAVSKRADNLPDDRARPVL